MVCSLAQTHCGTDRGGSACSSVPSGQGLPLLVYEDNNIKCSFTLGPCFLESSAVRFAQVFSAMRLECNVRIKYCLFSVRFLFLCF